MLRRDVTPVQRQNVGYRDCSRWTDAGFRLIEVPATDVFGESFFSLFTIIKAASSALSVFTIFDEPRGLMRDVSVSVILGIAQPEPCTLASTRHSSLMRSIASNVVYSLPAVPSRPSC